MTIHDFVIMAFGFVVTALLIPITRYAVQVLTDKFNQRLTLLEQSNHSLKLELVEAKKMLSEIERRVAIHDTEVAELDKKLDRLTIQIDKLSDKIDNIPLMVLDLLKKISK